MSENLQGAVEQESRLSEQQYDNPILNIIARWRYYKHADSPVDYLDKAMATARLPESGTLLDVGCSFGHDLLTIRNNYGFAGQLIGLEKSEKALSIKGRLDEGTFRSEGTDTVDWLVGDASSIPLADDSVDVLLASRMLYHIPDYMKALQEFGRVVKPGGDIFITTAGDSNKIKHRAFERAVADHISQHMRIPTTPPPVFTTRFNSHIGDAVLPHFFTLTGRHTQHANAVFDESNYDDYLVSFDTMRASFSPAPSHEQWEEAKLAVMLPVILGDIERTGVFTDTIEQRLFLCENVGRGVRL